MVKILWRCKKREEFTDEELTELQDWLRASELHEDLLDDLINTAKWDEEIAALLEKDSNATWNKIKKRVEEMLRKQ